MSTHTHAELYGKLRSHLLSRHYALGRYWRTNYFTNISNRLADWPIPPTFPSLGPDRDYFCQYDDGRTCESFAQRPQTGPPQRLPSIFGSLPNWKYNYLYPNADAILKDPTALDIERWRVFRHDRSNSLMATGLRLVSLCTDYILGDPMHGKPAPGQRLHGDPLALNVIDLTMDTLQSLFKFAAPNNPTNAFSGYILRWDPATSDNWWVTVSRPDPTKDGATEHPWTCCDFMINPDPAGFKANHFLYVAGFDDPRQQWAEAHGKEGRYRRWEPSIDEYVGLITGYFMVWHTFKDAANEPASTLQPHSKEYQVLQKVINQTTMVAKYLQHVGYTLIRPDPGNGSVSGFTGDGASGFNLCLAYPFSRVFKRITGDPFLPDSLGFRQILEMAGVWDTWTSMEGVGDNLNKIKEILTDPDYNFLTIFTNWLKGAPSNSAADNLSSFLSLPWGSATATIIAEVYLKSDCFNVLHKSKDDKYEGLLQFALEVVLQKFVAMENAAGQDGLRYIFEKWMAMPCNPIFRPGGDYFKFWIGLTALDDPVTFVKGAFTKWYNETRAASRVIHDADLGTGTLVPTNPDEIEGTQYWCEEAFGLAVYNLLNPGSPDNENKLRNRLDKMRDTLVGKYHSNLVLDDKDEDGNNTTYEWDDKKKDTWFGYMAALSLAWLQQTRQDNPFYTTSTGEDTPLPDTVSHWTVPNVPADVIAARLLHGFPVPIDAIRLDSAGQKFHPTIPIPPWGLLLFDTSPQNNTPRKPRDNECGDVPPPLSGSTFHLKIVDDTPDMEKKKKADLTFRTVVKSVQYSCPLPNLAQLAQANHINPHLVSLYKQCVPVFPNGLTKKSVKSEQTAITSGTFTWTVEFIEWGWKSKDTLVGEFSYYSQYDTGTYEGDCYLSWVAG